ncbi:universal stress protein [Streptomyces sp. NPDC056697]|uniref:universal stress protein n=1 Tax=Streptomyces sp. NPDC056697 TaxID=3345915 RepID=UPI00369E4ED5
MPRHVEHGHAAEDLLGAASQPGLMVVGRPIDRPAVGLRLDHVAHALLHHAACPVAVVPHS